MARWPLQHAPLLDNYIDYQKRSILEWNVCDDMYRMARWSFSSWCDVNRSTFEFWLKLKLTIWKHSKSAPSKLYFSLLLEVCHIILSFLLQIWLPWPHVETKSLESSLWTLPKLFPVFITSFLHRGTNHLHQGLEVKKHLLGYIPVLNVTAHSFTMP